MNSPDMNSPDEERLPDERAGERPDPEQLTELTGVDADPAEVLRIEHEEALAARRLSSIEAGRRKGGVLGAAAAGAMLGLRDIYEGPPKDDDVVAVAESPGDPGDIDEDGIDVSVGEVDVWAPPPPPSDRDAGPDNGAQV